MNNSRWVIFSLVLSLGFNLLLLGVLIGSFISKKPNTKPLPTSLGWMIHHLDSASLESIQPQMEAHARKVAPIRKEMRKTQQEFSRLLGQANPNDKALTNTLSQLRNHSDEYQREMHYMILELIPRLNKDQRRKIIKMLRRPPRVNVKHGDR
ncbi:MAG: periplasmic heavy metal sensor [Candidatus Azotimanducaceae bacterium]|uniref:Signaling pathway modulator ZraP n=1 Tax=OM182 bacterium TaxID=2510334 RepID=A0A520S3Q8_9GAMM|nr:MAG: periplasmic heavy metal sensor [OM182 bacterium]